jgi:hypothetical protein
VLKPETVGNAHIFWALHEGPPADVPGEQSGGEALVLIRAGHDRDAVHVVSFVDLESAESFARFEVKRGLDIGLVLIYWASFANVIETPFGLRLDPPAPPDPRQWRAAALNAAVAARAQSAQAATRRSGFQDGATGDEFGREPRPMPQARPALERLSPADHVSLQRAAAQVQPQLEAQPEREPEPLARFVEEPLPQEGHEPDPQAEDPTAETAIDESAEVGSIETLSSEDSPPEPEQPGEVVEMDPSVVEAEAITGEVAEAEATAPSPEEPLNGEPEEIDRLLEGAEEEPVPDVEEPAEEVEIPPAFAAASEEAVQTNGHHADAVEALPEHQLQIERVGEVESTPGDEEVAERLIHEALKDVPEEEPAPEPSPALDMPEPVQAIEPAIEEVRSPEPEPPKRERAKAGAAKNEARAQRGTDDDEDGEEQEFLEIDVNEIVEKTLKVKRWKKQDEPFKGFESPPGRF